MNLRCPHCHADQTTPNVHNAMSYRCTRCEVVNTRAAFGENSPPEKPSSPSYDLQFMKSEAWSQHALEISGSSGLLTCPQCAHHKLYSSTLQEGLYVCGDCHYSFTRDQGQVVWPPEEDDDHVMSCWECESLDITMEAPRAEFATCNGCGIQRHMRWFNRVKPPRFDDASHAVDMCPSCSSMEVEGIVFDSSTPHVRRCKACGHEGSAPDFISVMPSIPEPPPKAQGTDVARLLVGLLESSGKPQNWIDLVNARRAYGMKEYGQPLMSHDGRDTYKDLSDEVSDALVYTTKELVRGEMTPEQRSELAAMMRYNADLLEYGGAARAMLTAVADLAKILTKDVMWNALKDTLSSMAKES